MMTDKGEEGEMGGGKLFLSIQIYVSLCVRKWKRKRKADEKKNFSLHALSSMTGKKNLYQEILACFFFFLLSAKTEVRKKNPLSLKDVTH